jgi:phosphatidate cytidylyltransferase
MLAAAISLLLAFGMEGPNAVAQAPDRAPMETGPMSDAQPPLSDADPMEDAPLEETPLTTPGANAAGPPSAVAAWLDAPTVWLLGVVLGLLVVAFIVGRVLRRQPENSVNPALVRTFNQRVRAYWMMCAILIAGFLLGRIATVVLFGLVSFWALREYITMTPTRRSDHRALFWTFFVLLPLQFVLVAIGQALYDVYAILIPVYASLFIPARIAFAGDHKRFLERIAKIQAGLMICVYSLSYAPALLDLPLRTSQGERWGYGDSPGSMAGLLFYFVLVAQLGDILSYVWGKLLGRRVIAPTINASKTWEGFIGGTLSTTLVGTLLWWVTPFNPWESACMSLVIALMGFAGAMTMSAIKRDRGVRDYGTLVTGHAGVLDRIDSICFAAPIFFHLVRVFFTR